MKSTVVFTEWTIPTGLKFFEIFQPNCRKSLVCKIPENLKNAGIANLCFLCIGDSNEAIF